MAMVTTEKYGKTMRTCFEKGMRSFFMASKELEKRVKAVEQIVSKSELTEEYADAMYQYGKYAIRQEKDVEYGLKCLTRAKEWTVKLIEDKTHGTVWDLDAYCFANDKHYSIMELFYKILLEESYYNLESYIYYMERKREPNKRFYLPRKKTLKVVLHDLEDLANRKIKFLGLSMPSRTGKLIADETPVLTENGWKKHGDLRVGDYVYDFDGQLVEVVYIHPKQYANKRVWFSDGTYIDCHENHEWILYDRCSQEEFRVETNYVESHICTKEGNGTRPRWYLPKKEVLLGSCMKKLKVPPYVLGAWLGDGTNRKPVLTICDTDTAIVDEVVRLGYNYTAKHQQAGCSAYYFENLRADLQNYGMCNKNYATEKHIPADYLNATINQRLELLAGLLDTDGTLVAKEHRYHFSTISEQLRDDVIALVSTFGWRVCVTTDKARTSSSGIVGKHDVYKISFNPTMHIPCKVARKQLFEFSKQRRISVEKIEDIEPVSGNCITVMGGTYRVGKRMIPTHNSTLCIFFLSWIALKRPNSHSAMGGHSGILAKGFYKELMNLFTTEEYCYQEMFEYFYPGHTCIREKSAEEFTITLDQPDRFATITCRGVDGTWTGAVDVSWDGILYVDDMVRDREHSLSPQRMETTFQEYQNKMVDRKSGYYPGYGDFAGSCELMVGTLWNVLDPLERMRKMHEDDPLYRFRRIPALDENDESNFDYEVNGFTTEYYREMRERLDNAEWMAKYQQQPFVREGLILPSDELNYFNGILPEGDSKSVSVCDVAYGGGDSLSMPIAREYENGDVYVYGWVFNNGAKEITIPKVVGGIIANEIRDITFEGNQGGDMYCAYVDDELKKNHYKCSCTSRKAPNTMAKMEKIVAYSGDIKKKFYFLTPKQPTKEELEEDRRLGITRYVRDKEYQKAMDEMSSCVSIGKNEHDDAIDSIVQMAMKVDGYGMSATAQAIKNPFRSIGRY